MRNTEQLGQESDRGRRSFNRFLAIILVVMLFTGYLAIRDNWASDIVETTGQHEQKQLALPDDVKIILEENSQISFQKGATHKIILSGTATVQIGDVRPTKKITIETTEMIINTRSARYQVESIAGQTSVKLVEGDLELILKPDVEKIVRLRSGEEYRHALIH